MVGTSGFTRHAVKVGQATARGYTTKPIKGSIAFKCVQCEYSVTTLDFQSKDGNARTQARSMSTLSLCITNPCWVHRRIGNVTLGRSAPSGFPESG